MNKYQEALDKVKSVPLFIEPKPDRNGWKIYLEVSSIEEKNKTDIDVLQELVDKQSNLIEYLIEQRQAHTMSRFVSASELNSFRYAIDLILDYYGQPLDWRKDE